MAKDNFGKSGWKEFERFVARELGGKRKIRGDYSESSPDIILSQKLSFLKIDCKKRASFMHHELLKEIKEKYCHKKSDIPILISKEKGGRDVLATLPFAFFKKIINNYKSSLKKGG